MCVGFTGRNEEETDLDNDGECDVMKEEISEFSLSATLVGPGAMNDLFPSSPSFFLLSSLEWIDGMVNVYYYGLILCLLQ